MQASCLGAQGLGRIGGAQAIEAQPGSPEARIFKVKALLLDKQWEAAVMEARAAHDTHRGNGAVFQVRQALAQAPQALAHASPALVREP